MSPLGWIDYGPWRRAFYNRPPMPAITTPCVPEGASQILTQVTSASEFVESGDSPCENAGILENARIG